MPQDNTMPKVVDGKLDRPYPINSLADVSRARVLPPPKMQSKAAEYGYQRGQKVAEDVTRKLRKDTRGKTDVQPDDERPKGGFDYVVRRNRMLKGISGRTRPRSQSRRA